MIEIREVKNAIMNNPLDMARLAKLSYEKYSRETSSHENLPILPYNEISSATGKISAVVATDDEKIVGFLLYEAVENDGVTYCNIPLFGYGAENMKVLDRLFGFLAEKIVLGKTEFSVHIYAHDRETQRLFSFLQFYMMSEKCIRIYNNEEVATCATIRKLSKNELDERWKDVWSMVSSIIKHLQSSPIFYPGEEFTEEVYREFLTVCDVYVAEMDGKYIGMIEANGKKPLFPYDYTNAVNVGEIYLEPEYRGKGIAETLLHFAENDQKSAVSWVEHGTANPNARGFWNKHFETYEYLMMRKINDYSFLKK